MSTPSLNKLLEKLGLKYEDLTEEERQTYNNWSNTLSTPNVTIDHLKAFLTQYIAGLELDQVKYDNSPQKDLYLKAVIRNAKMIQAFIHGPEKRKEWLERHIDQRARQS
jgi:hypothetical protein